LSYPQIYAHLNPKFLELMDELMHYGATKHKENSFQAQVARGSFERPGPRWTSNTILSHIHKHALDYEQEVLHDHFSDLEHQLAAIAVNAMMECYFLLGESRDRIDSATGSADASPEKEE